MGSKRRRQSAPPRVVAPPVPVVLDPLVEERRRFDAFASLAAAVAERDRAEQRIAEQVRAAREVGASWHRIGVYCSMTGEGARRKWGTSGAAT